MAAELGQQTVELSTLVTGVAHDNLSCAALTYQMTYHGYMVGNGVTDEQIDGNALVPFVHGMRLIPDELFEEVNRECNGNFYDPTSDNCSSELSKVDELK
ncbi:hypothetical protein JHK85_007122 [Glycine max]|nr:hypothetical protein JHK85_007122 [Glycine max]